MNMNSFVRPEEADYVVLRDLGTLSTHSHGMEVKVTLGRWYGKLRLDIRYWWEGKLGRGISLGEKQVRLLRKILDETPFGL